MLRTDNKDRAIPQTASIKSSSQKSDDLRARERKKERKKNQKIWALVLVWFLAMLSAIPYALFTRLNYVDRPLGSGNFLHESAFCALLDSNIYPQVCIATMAGILIFCPKTMIFIIRKNQIKIQIQYLMYHFQTKKKRLYCHIV